MPKKFIQKFLPDSNKLKEHKNLQFLGERLHQPNLWHLNRRSVSLAFAIGLFCAWIPVPGQMVIAAFAAFYFGANLPISVALVWLTNPVTMPALFYFAYIFGLFLLGEKSTQSESDFSVDVLLSSLGDIWQPFLLGCLVLGIVSCILGFLTSRWLWVYMVQQQWKKRKFRVKKDS
ncbi:MAG: DUF2062 domain-containing protein [Methylococcaceae bacterium]